MTVALSQIVHIYIYMEMSPGNQCIAILNTQKYLHLFFFTKSENRRVE
jgi:hypothetical protein